MHLSGFLPELAPGSVLRACVGILPLTPEAAYHQLVLADLAAQQDPHFAGYRISTAAAHPAGKHCVRMNRHMGGQKKHDRSKSRAGVRQGITSRTRNQSPCTYTTLCSAKQ